MRPLVSFIALGLLAVSAAHADSLAGPIGAELYIDNDSLAVGIIDKDGPADKAGLKEGDVIVKVNDLVVKEKGLTGLEVEAVGKEFLKHKPGEKIRLTVKRDGKEHRVEVTVRK